MKTWIDCKQCEFLTTRKSRYGLKYMACKKFGAKYTIENSLKECVKK